MFSARSSDDIAPANDSVTQTPIVIGVGDTNLTAVGRAGLRGRARAGHGPVAAKRLRVRRVDVAVQRLGGTRCVWLRARGVRSWRLGLRSALPRGRYVAFSRATIAMGFPEASFTAKDRNRVAFTVR